MPRLVFEFKQNTGNIILPAIPFFMPALISSSVKSPSSKYLFIKSSSDSAIDSTNSFLNSSALSTASAGISALVILPSSSNTNNDFDKISTTLVIPFPVLTGNWRTVTEEPYASFNS